MTKAMVYVPYVKNRIYLNNIKKGELKMVVDISFNIVGIICLTIIVVYIIKELK